jgi:hypothetical protein
MPYVLTNEALELPEDVLEMFESEYYSTADPNEKKFTSHVIYLYTEATIHNNVILHAHPNFGGSGPIYDFAVVPGSILMDQNVDAIAQSLPDQNECPMLGRALWRVNVLFSSFRSLFDC